MFTLPDDLREYNKQSPVLYYHHVNTADNNNSRLHFTRPCISIGVNGIKKLQTPKGVEDFDAGDLIFYTPGNYLSYQNFDTERPYQTIMIFFDPLALFDLARQFGEKNNGSLEDTEYYRALRGDAYIATFGRSILDLLALEQSFTNSLQKIKLIELVLYLKGTFGNFINEETRHFRQLSDQQLQKVIEDTCNRNLTLEEISFMCNMSLATFKRTFARIYGTSPGRWIRERKLSWAEEQIRRFHRLPKEIYDEAGYGDYSSFSYAFKQKFGTSPKHRRRQSD